MSEVFLPKLFAIYVKHGSQPLLYPEVFSLKSRKFVKSMKFTRGVNARLYPGRYLVFADMSKPPSLIVTKVALLVLPRENFKDIHFEQHVTGDGHTYKLILENECELSLESLPAPVLYYMFFRVGLAWDVMLPRKVKPSLYGFTFTEEDVKQLLEHVGQGGETVAYVSPSDRAVVVKMLLGEA